MHYPSIYIDYQCIFKYIYMCSKKLAVLTDEVLLYYRRYILSNIYILVIKFLFIDFFANFSTFLYKYKINIPIYIYICMYK